MIEQARCAWLPFTSRAEAILCAPQGALFKALRIDPKRMYVLGTPAQVEASRSIHLSNYTTELDPEIASLLNMNPHRKAEPSKHQPHHNHSPRHQAMPQVLLLHGSILNTILE